MAKDKNTGRNPRGYSDAGNNAYGNQGYPNAGYGNNGYGGYAGGGYGNQNPYGNQAPGNNNPYGNQQQTVTGYNGMQFSRIPVKGEAKPNEQTMTAQSKAPKEGKQTKTEKIALPEQGKRTRKQKKLAKKSEKFDEMDLRNYPMTVGSWIGTFILLAIPLIGGICAICWFFGVGNKSRSAWVRSYVVITLLIVLIIGIALGVGWTLLSKAAKADGANAPNEVLFYGACKVVDLIGPVIGNDEAVEGVKSMIAEVLKVDYKPAGSENGGENEENGGENAGGGSGGEIIGGEGEIENSPEFQAA